MTQANKAFGARPPRRDMTVTVEHDHTCPDCRGKGVDKFGFDCTRCGGEGVVDE
jgi:DnaJ-class molecular chaperone